MVNSITEGIKLQSQNRPNRSRKTNESDSRFENGGGGGAANGNGGGGGHHLAGQGEGSSGASRETTSGGASETNRQTSNPPSVRSTPSPVPSNFSSGTSNKFKRARSILTSERSEESESNSEVECSRTEGNDSNVDTEGEGGSELGLNDEIELVFKPHPTEMAADNPLVKALKENCIRYLKTTANASGLFIDFVHKSVVNAIIFPPSGSSQQVSGHAIDARSGNGAARSRSSAELLHLHCSTATATARSERQSDAAPSQR